MAKTTDAIRELLPDLIGELFSKPNVVAAGIGYKRVQGKKTGTPCIVCSVEKKVPSSELTRRQFIPAGFSGIPTDVYPVGLIHALGLPTGRFRPAPGGVSIGHVHITAGTLGCLVRKGGRAYILSNNHVLANSNSANMGDMILQPGPADGGDISKDQIARLDAFIPIRFENETRNCLLTRSVTGAFNFIARLAGSGTRLFAKESAQTPNLADCAIAEPLSEGDVTDDILQTGMITGIAAGELDMKIRKSGRTTGLTEGTIEQVDATVRVNFGAGKTALFSDQLIAGDMSRGGDSGSVVLSAGNEILGLLFAGSTNTTIINRIENVFTLLDISLD